VTALDSTYDDLIALTNTDGERAFAVAVIDFVSAHYDRRSETSSRWGEGDEALSLFHESTDTEERAEAQRAQDWQRRRWDAGFGSIAGPLEYGGRGLALVRTDPQAAKPRGLTMFLVPMNTPGIEVRPRRQITGGASFAETFIDDVRRPDRLRIGAEGEGWAITARALAGERKAVGDRMQATPDVGLTGAERAIDKLLVAANSREIGQLAAELLGPAFAADTGEWGTFAWTKWSLGALGYRIAGGTEEVIKTMLAERVLGLPRENRK
jgi:alkylation response protein AidB-like acyl-CoA dehydrogenase